MFRLSIYIKIKPMPVSKKNSDNEIALRGIEYFQKKRTIKSLEAECKSCRECLESFIDSSGSTLPNGSRISVIPYADVDVCLKKTLRVGKVLLPEAIDILRDNGLDECIEEVPMVREDVIERLYLSGKISDDVLKKVYADKSTYAFSVDVKSRITDGPEES